ncbi:MAG: glutaredoxin domain-containing protein [Acidimicrobiales bacterium]|nr:glutaredoxin domain-containing protein [Acidimicrobiales bacterium]
MDKDETAVDVYWRRGCGFCASMRTALAEAGVEARWHDIWADPDSAAFVRSVAGGNETVPTVQLGDEVLVAPRPRAVIDQLVDADPEAVVDARRWPPLRIAQWITVAAVVVAWNALTPAGQAALGWIVGGGVLAAFVAVRRRRARVRTRPTSGQSG